MTVWVLVTVWFFGDGETNRIVEMFPTKQQCEYERLAHPNYVTSPCTPITIKRPS